MKIATQTKNKQQENTNYLMKMQTKLSTNNKRTIPRKKKISYCIEQK